MRVSEFAKELGKSSKEVLEILQKNNFDVKSHASNVSDDQMAAVRRVYGGNHTSAGAHTAQANHAAPAAPAAHTQAPAAHTQAPAPKTEAPAAPAAKPEGEAPKKKTVVFRPQNAQQQIRTQRPQQQGQGQRPGSRPQGQPERTQGSAAPAGNRDNANSARVQAQNVSADNTANRAQAPAAPAAAGHDSGASRPQPAAAPAAPAAPVASAAPAASHENTASRPQSDTGYQGNRDGQSRPQGQGYQGNRDNQNRPQGQGYQGNRDGQRPQGQGYQGNRPQGQGGYQGNRPQGQGGYQGNRPQGQGGYQGNRSQSGGYQGRPAGPGARGGQRDGAKSYDTPIQAKPQSNRGNKNNYKNDKYDKRNMTEDGPRAKGKVSKHPFIMPQKTAEDKVEEVIKVITVPEVLTIKELAEKMKLQPSAIVKKLFLKGTIVTLNQEIDYDKAEEIAMEYDILCEKEVKVDVIEELLKEDEEDEADMVSRPAVVCVMGHVDHGKTSLLDAIRETNVTSREAGGITQHIGAYVVEINGQKITFLDTPGHEAFTAMRMRGAKSTDIAVLVVAADDGVMPQTVEAINHAKAAGVEIIVAINKIDKPSANVERVKQELSEYELVPEDWGGSTIFVPVSAHTKEGISDLLEMIILTSEVKELKANPNRTARGLVIEAELDKGKGSVATVLVQKGTLHVGDNIAAGACFGKVRAMMDDKGRRVKEAGPSMPVEILGLNDVPNAGEVFVATANEKEARSFAETFISEGKNKLLEDTKAKLSLDDLFSQIKAGNVKELPIIVKADVQGSVEAVKQSLVKLSNDEVMVKVIHGGVGAINESDVTLASASNAIIIGFNVRPDVTAKSIADREKVDLRLYKVIYQAIEDVEAAMKGMLDPIFEEKVIGHAVVRQTFKASGVGTIAGSYVMDGKFQRGCSVRITRDGAQIFDGALASLKRFKDDVKEVATGYECGLVFEKFNDVQEDDMVEAYAMVEVPR